MESMNAPWRTEPTSSSPRNISDDILWLIFMINTENDIIKSSEPHPLDTTRISSQVCRQWRSVLLGTSSIWGRLMNWLSLRQKSHHWRNLVLKRSGTSLLWISCPPPIMCGICPSRGYCSRVSTLAESVESCPLLWFQTLIIQNWERIEKLRFIDSYGCLDINIQGLLGCKAPNLQSISLSSSPPDEYRGEMFSNYAPRLREFKSMFKHCNLDIAWVSNLRSLSLGENFNNKEICEALSHMPYLNSLTLKQHKLVDDYHPPLINLPCLRTLILDNCLIYLRDIIIPPSTTLYLSGRVYNGQESYENHLASKLHNRFAEIPPKSIHIYLSITEFSLRDDMGSFYYPDPSSRSFYLRTKTYTRLSAETRMVNIINTMSSAYFSTVTVLELATFLTFYQGEQIFHSFNRFMSHFSAVETLKIHEEGIFILTQYIDAANKTDESEAPLFPMLRYLTVSKMDFRRSRKDKCDCEYHPGRFSGSIEQFLKWRSNQGMPNIQILSLDRTASPKYEDPSGHGMRSLDPALDELAGMKVVWKFEDRVVEYECGSGFPERLKYDETYRHCEIWNGGAEQNF